MDQKAQHSEKMETDVHNVKHIDFTTAKTERMDDFIREGQKHKKEMERLGNKLRKLKEDIASLTASQESQKETDRRREKW